MWSAADRVGSGQLAVRSSAVACRSRSAQRCLSCCWIVASACYAYGPTRVEAGLVAPELRLGCSGPPGLGPHGVAGTGHGPVGAAMTTQLTPWLVAQAFGVAVLCAGGPFLLAGVFAILVERYTGALADRRTASIQGARAVRPAGGERDPQAPPPATPTPGGCGLPSPSASAGSRPARPPRRVRVVGLPTPSARLAAPAVPAGAAALPRAAAPAGLRTVGCGDG